MGSPSGPGVQALTCGQMWGWKSSLTALRHALPHTRSAAFIGECIWWRRLLATHPVMVVGPMSERP